VYRVSVLLEGRKGVRAHRPQLAVEIAANLKNSRSGKVRLVDLLKTKNVATDVKNEVVTWW
jgi:hypothetical protein